MDSKKKRTVLLCLLWTIVSLSLIISGIYWSLFYVLSIGVLLLISTLVYAISACINGNGDDAVGLGCLLFMGFAVLVFFFHKDRYIVPTDDKQHIYIDCPIITGNASIKEVTELQGFFYLTFSDCKKCLVRKQIEIDKKREARKQKKREGLKKYLQIMIDRLDAGEDADEIADEISEDFMPDEDGDFATVPSKYR